VWWCGGARGWPSWRSSRNCRQSRWSAPPKQLHPDKDDYPQQGYGCDQSAAPPKPAGSRQPSFYQSLGGVLVRSAASLVSGIRHLRTCPYRPQTNGKAERFIQTMLREWAYGRLYGSSAERAGQLGGWLDRYNYRRKHGSLGHPASGPASTSCWGTTWLGTTAS
jgi:hypothetical protein